MWNCDSFSDLWSLVGGSSKMSLSHQVLLGGIWILILLKLFVTERWILNKRRAEMFCTRFKPQASFHLQSLGRLKRPHELSLSKILATAVVQEPVYIQISSVVIHNTVINHLIWASRVSFTAWWVFLHKPYLVL